MHLKLWFGVAAFVEVYKQIQQNCEVDIYVTKIHFREGVKISMDWF